MDKLHIPIALCVALLGLETITHGCASNRSTHQASTSIQKDSPNPAPDNRRASGTPTDKPADNPKVPDAFLCEKSRGLGPRYKLEFHGPLLSSKQKRIPTPYSLRLPKGAQPARAWIDGTEDPECIGVDSNACSSIDKEILETKHFLELCGEKKRSTPIVGVFYKYFSIFGSPESRQESVDQLLRKCGVSNTGSWQTMKVSDDLISHQKLSERAMDQSCTVDFTHVESYDHSDRNSMHYHGFAVYDSTPKSFNIAVVVFVVHEKDWPIVADTVRASARTFEVNWDALYAREALQNQ